MKVSREQMQANRLRILDAAGRLFRERGFASVSVAEVMQAAGLTHGGFYGHFASKDDLIAQTLAHISEGGETTGQGLDAFLDGYLSPRHRDGVAQGCPMAALAADTRRQTPEARAAMTDSLRSQISRIAASISSTDAPQARQKAIGLWASMVGAVILARTADDEALSDEILSATRAWIGDRAAD
ncbi:TetR/AcrR family transcriptional regulator [Phenylobacterium sp.]|uniref:TetR/AcrR family transcriptional regulator n=1 Tax=Phenylobacterium sp. TaxID=1871053 RepID=UPI00272FDC89|nr:TetR family transcriptional regulator [Phenylobacterium sp.]MDP1617969.1 TetR family transcriptional regulator [Phenylobacterium sp.]MDP1988812.1 TetR family transcriptional regulator [Phenylobacterium sp.]